jgi:hypothetical protein
MKAEKAANIALENDELTDILELNSYVITHKSVYGDCKTPSTFMNSTIS